MTGHWVRKLDAPYLVCVRQVFCDMLCPYWTCKYECTHCCDGPLINSKSKTAHTDVKMGAPPAGEAMER